MTLGSRRSALIGLLGAAFVVACGSAPAAAQGKFKAVTTFTVIADIARNVAGDVAVVESITKPGAEIHNYQPTPRAQPMQQAMQRPQAAARPAIQARPMPARQASQTRQVHGVRNLEP